MRLVRTLFIVAAGVALVAAVPSAEAAKKAKKEHNVKGVVASVEKDKDKDTGTITLKIAAKKNKKTGQETAAEDKKFKVTETTKFIKVTGKKAGAKDEPATFAELKDGEKATVTVKGDDVVEVKFHPKKEKKKNK